MEILWHRVVVAAAGFPKLDARNQPEDRATARLVPASGGPRSRGRDLSQLQCRITRATWLNLQRRSTANGETCDYVLETRGASVAKESHQGSSLIIWRNVDSSLLSSWNEVKNWISQGGLKSGSSVPSACVHWILVILSAGGYCCQ